MNNKFIETLNVSNYSVLTENGFSNIENIGKTILFDEYYVETNTHHLYCADEHLLIDKNYHPIKVCDLKVDDEIMVNGGCEKIVKVYQTNRKLNMFDLQLCRNSTNRYYTNDILSHNSMWMHNIASNMANNGKNVLIVTLEMQDYKVMKRIDCMRFDINSREYDNVRQDTTFMKTKYNNLKSKSYGIETKMGKVFIKKFPTSKLSPSELEVYVKKIQDRKGIKIDVMFVDYLTIMGLEKGLAFNESMLFLKGKYLAEGLRRIADEFNMTVVTAIQTKKDVWGANDIDIKDVPESKGIPESADDMYAIIRNPEMQKQNKYRLKQLKRRDGELSNKQIVFDFNPINLRIENDEYFDMEEAEKEIVNNKKFKRN